MGRNHKESTCVSSKCLDFFYVVHFKVIICHRCSQHRHIVQTHIEESAQMYSNELPLHIYPHLSEISAFCKLVPHKNYC